MTKDELRAKANELPLLPGVYLMMDKTGQVIYVGKAKKLKNRVSQYFQDTASHNGKTRRMVSQVDLAGQPHAAQSGQGLQVAGQIFPRDRVVKGRQEDHDQRVLPFAQLVKIIARCGGGIKGETGDGGANQMF
mgnify:CR=1 FL=1